MLSEKTLTIVKATVPALKANGEAITSHFYETMLSEYPVLRAFFNETHQREGTQARALAGAVLAYATYIDKLEVLEPALPRIIQKHVALGVKPEFYPIVGDSLLKAIRHVLGSAATADIMEAWAQAYGSFADLLIRLEEDVYASTEAARGGWRGVRRFRVAGKARESETIAAWVRLDTSSLSRMATTCDFTVPSPMLRRFAIALLPRPSANRAKTVTSRGVSFSRAKLSTTHFIAASLRYREPENSIRTQFTSSSWLQWERR
jgi:hemoglobin-like flavoprotein